ncbi:citrate lyase beta subunit [bacterium]|nr:citrate lyase beta subunit [bacterium]
MNDLEKKMVDALSDLKEKHHVVGVKAEFEAEGTRLEEAMRLKEVVTKAGLELTMKIGGCEALKDMYDARIIGVNAIVAPMIESAYALKKYIKSTKLAFPECEWKDTKFLINIETISGYNCLDEILSSEESESLAGIVMGRVDMTGSLGLTREDINDDRILEIAKNIARKAQEHKKEMVIGGGVSKYSIPFFASLPEGSLTRFETRKIIFDAPKAIADSNTDKGLMKAVGFELLWLKNKRNFYKNIFEEDTQRLQMLECRYKELIAEAGGHYE